MIVERHYSSYKKLSFKQLRKLIRDNRHKLADRYWVGPPKLLFDGNLATTRSGSFYLPDTVEYDKSTGFWIPSQPLHLSDSHYLYGETTLAIKYVGDTRPFPDIFRHAVVRVSLATHWQNNDGAAGCWLQISGVF